MSHESGRFYNELLRFAYSLSKFVDDAEERGVIAKNETEMLAKIESIFLDVAESVEERMSGEPKTLRSL